MRSQIKGPSVALGYLARLYKGLGQLTSPRCPSQQAPLHLRKVRTLHKPPLTQIARLLPKRPNPHRCTRPPCTTSPRSADLLTPAPLFFYCATAPHTTHHRERSPQHTLLPYLASPTTRLSTRTCPPTAAHIDLSVRVQLHYIHIHIHHQYTLNGPYRHYVHQWPDSDSKPSRLRLRGKRAYGML